MSRSFVFCFVFSSLLVVACTDRDGDPPPPRRDAGTDAGHDAGAVVPGEDGGQDGGRREICGNGRVVDDEECDDLNRLPGDGCDINCQIEPGWRCPGEGLPCVAAECGDSIIAGGTGALGEECDDGNAAAGDGCSDTCKVEDGWVCNAASVCRRTICGDAVVEGSEDCDDGNDDPFDLCGQCLIVPRCNVGACQAVCGDGMIFPGEACDDGNAADGDGCSATCTLEEGWTCAMETEEPGASLEVPAVFRDFIAHATATGTALTSQDFTHTVGSQGVSPGMVEDILDPMSHPVYTGVCELGMEATSCRGDSAGRWQTHSEALWNQWYQGGPLARNVVSSLTLTRGGTGTYTFSPAGGFFPVDNAGWVMSGEERPDPGCNPPHNFGFTSEVRYWFTFAGGEQLTFSGDDDVWVFIGGRLALDLGGIHGQLSGTVTLGETGVATCSGTCTTATRDLGLVVGQVYEIALFHAERRGCGSNFRLDLRGFTRVRSTCTENCGDGVLTSGEQCDDGNRIDDDECNNECEFSGPI